MNDIDYKKTINEYTHLLFDIYSKAKVENIEIDYSNGNIRLVYADSIQCLVDTIRKDLKDYITTHKYEVK